MVNMNFKNYFKGNLKGTISNGGVNYLGQTFNIGSSSFLGNAELVTDYIPTGSNYGRFTVLYGKGKTPPTVNDITIEDIITSGWQHLTLSSSLSNDSVIITDAITNVSSEDIEINEFGINAKMGTGAGSCIVYREVLDKPLILKPNDIYTFTIKLSLA